MSEAKWLIVMGAGLTVAIAVSCLVFAWASLRESREERIDHLEKQWKHLRDGMKRAGTWKSDFDVPSSQKTFRIKDGSA